MNFFANLEKVSLRQKTKPNVPRPHTVHLERSTVSPEKEDEERTRTFSDSQEQDENKPPAEVFKLFLSVFKRVSFLCQYQNIV